MSCAQALSLWRWVVGMGLSGRCGGVFEAPEECAVVVERVVRNVAAIELTAMARGGA